VDNVDNSVDNSRTALWHFLKLKSTDIAVFHFLNDCLPKTNDCVEINIITGFTSVFAAYLINRDTIVSIIRAHL
jgi:hypothetical protein